MPTIVKTLVDIGPLIVFYITESFSDIFVATGFLMVACLIAFAVSWKMTRKLALLPALTLAFALVFGGFTLLFEDDTFIKIEVTLTNALLGLFLLGGMYFNKSLLKILFDGFADMTEDGWRIITWRMGWFFLAIAALNEFVWRSFSTDIWVDFRVFGILGLTFAFLASQVPTVMRHMISPPQDEGE